VGNVLIPRSGLQFYRAPLQQFLVLYEMIADRKVEHDAVVPGLDSTVISLSAASHLTQPEAVYACMAALALNGVKLVPGEGGKLKPVPVSR
jgi:hypothetical protein